MNLNSFSYVIEVERCGSINRAAQNLYVSQSNLSSAIKVLEDEIGYHIFTRTSKGIETTLEGNMFIQSAKAIMVEVNKIYNVPNDISPSSDISISSTWSAQLLKMFIAFKSKNKIEAQDYYKETGLKQNFQDVQENQYRLSIFYCFHSRLEYHRKEAQKINLTTDVLVENIPVVVLLSSKHPLAKKEYVDLEDIYEYPLALFEDFEEADWINILKTPPNQRILYLFDRGAIVDTLQQGDFVSVIKKGAIARPSDQECVELPIRNLQDSLDIVLLRHKYYSVNNREKEFLQFLKKNYRA